MKHGVSLSLVLFAVWLLWSGHYGTFLLSLGVVSCAAVVLIAVRMRLVDSEGAPIEITLRAFAYVPWLAWQIVRANVDVAWRILSPGLPIEPRLIRVRASQKRDLGRAIYANSITLTPGTVAVDLEGDVITVHALSGEAAEGLETGEMDRRVRRLEGGR